MTPTRLIRVIAGMAVTVVALVALARGSALELPVSSPAEAMLRLSWTAHPERIDVCRDVPQAEQEQRPEHMRQRQICEGRVATYALRVEVDARLVGDAVVEGGGFRHDRPIFLLREFAVPSGTHRVQVTFVRRDSMPADVESEESEEPKESQPAVADTGIFAGRAEREVLERGRRTKAAIPPRLSLDTMLTFAPGRVILVSLDVDRRALTVMEGVGP